MRPKYGCMESLIKIWFEAWSMVIRGCKLPVTTFVINFDCEIDYIIHDHNLGLYHNLQRICKVKFAFNMSNINII